jgi:proline iminopeptidase
LTVVLALGYFVGVRPRLLRWGTTSEEADATLHGDTLIARAESSATMAVTLRAPPAQVWPWLIQMGCDRAGWYSWDRLDNGGRPSAMEIVPAWQELTVGDRLMSTPDGSSFFTAEIVNAPEVLVLRADLGLPRGNPIEPGDSLSRWWIRSSWAFVLNATNDGATRLVVRTRSIGNPAWAVRLANVLVGEPAHTIMQLRQFEGLRRRATLSRTDISAPGSIHPTPKTRMR